jgi:hypothetical protein
MFDLVIANLSSPMILAFLLGLVAVAIRSDLRLPEALYASLSICLLLAIGLKGGVAIRASGFEELLAPLVATLILSVVTPLTAYLFARWSGSFNQVDSAALAAHYGSVSVVTFFAALSFLEQLSLKPEPFMPALVAALEIPAIVIALLLVKSKESKGASFWKALHEVVAGKSIVLLVGGVAIGVISGQTGFAKVAPLFEELFPGLLVLFLLEIGMVCGSRIRDLGRVGGALVCYGILIPIMHGFIGVIAGYAAGLSHPGTVVLATMAASASYIAAPAAVRIALPEANPGYYVTASLGVTFPFNLSIGIPLYYWMTTFFYPNL